jgi:peptidoglycan/xylan/chitin deacetylase (PgdA/CDA1 family)
VSRYPIFRLSFDDGNASDASIVLPRLLSHGAVAEFFVVAGRLDRPGSLAASEVRTLAQAGMVVGSHGMRHRTWRGMDAVVTEEEMATAARAIAEVAGHAITAAACPFGAYDRGVLRALARHGYQRVYTVDGGSARPTSWMQSRYCVCQADRPTDLERLARDPSGGPSQAVVRQAKSLVKRWR